MRFRRNTGHQMAVMKGFSEWKLSIEWLRGCTLVLIIWLPGSSVLSFLNRRYMVNPSRVVRTCGRLMKVLRITDNP